MLASSVAVEVRGWIALTMVRFRNVICMVICTRNVCGEQRVTYACWLRDALWQPPPCHEVTYMCE